MITLFFIELALYGITSAFLIAAASAAAIWEVLPIAEYLFSWNVPIGREVSAIKTKSPKLKFSILISSKSPKNTLSLSEGWSIIFNSIKPLNGVLFITGVLNSVCFLFTKIEESPLYDVSIWFFSILVFLNLFKTLWYLLLISFTHPRIGWV